MVKKSDRDSSVLVILLGFIGAALAVAWIVGPLVESGDPASLDYIVEPLNLPGGIVIGLGVAGVVMVGAGAFVGWRRRPLRAISALAIVGGMIAGACYRLITAGAIGANIGGGLALLFGLPAAAVLLGTAIVSAVVNRRQSPPEHGRTRRSRAVR